MIEEFLYRIGEFTPFWIYVALFLFAYIENVFPPSPSDLVVVVGGSLVATDAIYFIPTLIITSIGSVLGFMTLYFIGTQVDRKLIGKGRLKFINREGLEKAEVWFHKYGYGIILANRFLPGTRAIISFFAGMSELRYQKTVLLATVSAFIWNAIIIYLGVLFGDNIAVVDEYLSTYSNIVIAVTGLIAIVLILRYFINKKKSKKD